MSEHLVQDQDQCKCNTYDCINVIELSYVNGFKSSNDRDGRVWQDGVVCDWCHLYYCQECLNADLIMLFDGYGDRLICTKCLDKGISDQTITECDVCDNNHKTIQCQQCLQHLCLGCLHYDFDELLTCNEHINYVW